jgi:hypothetical protein
LYIYKKYVIIFISTIKKPQKREKGKGGCMGNGKGKKGNKGFYKILRKFWARNSLPRKARVRLNNKNPEHPHPEVNKIPN